ncbi:MaoC family dehydratase [Undibacterium oligocarboniphilum]|uniref:MaoC family dehydratase n=1 Tax=Undibacterium oligocarboniphilum TaxID=666702 RepID=A0A850QGL7_9BURK|nr:MaoC family dehydratase [Undibacterium oligocarboniphilum]MBC3870308.1 MaoC family dehydratase [Undibacterium oligocarboniphilum]NVO78299.1 MaoC family dehydratase [Undibacterium oligocarboniphilum]
MREIHSLEELKSLIGQQLATSAWISIEQERINQFAEATGDHQWIHLDIERAKKESPFGGTIAHGFLTLSLLPMLMGNAIRLTYVKMGVNYGLNKVRFPAPVPAGSRVRGHIKLLQVEDIKDGAQMIWEVTIEREGSEKPVCIAESISRSY